MKTSTLWAGIIVLGGLLSLGFQGKPVTTTRPAKAAQGSWTRTPIGSSEMTVEFPGPAKATPVALPNEVKKNYDILETISCATSDFAAFASYAVSKAQKPISLDGAARGALDRVKNQADAPDYKETISTATVLGLPARKIQCSFTSGDKKLFLLGVIFTDRTRMWQVICTGQVSPANSAAGARVVASVKRVAPSATGGQPKPSSH